MGFSGNDPQTISEGGDGSSDEEEGPPIPLKEMNSPVVDEAMMDMINDGVEALAEENKKRPTAPKKKKKGQAVPANDRIVEVTTKLKELRPLIKQSVDTIARALGESEEHNVMRRDLMMNLDKLEGLSRVQKVLVFRRLNNNSSDLKSFYDLDEENKLTLVLDLLAQ
ncbi:hypothetical protein LINGRAHAP2_LOCUS30951 [Linum grandiflorum]